MKDEKSVAALKDSTQPPSAVRLKKNEDGRGFDLHPSSFRLHPFVVKRLGRVDYLPTWRAMQEFTGRRDETTSDEIWLLEHPPVFTLGLAGKPEHVLDPGDIPVMQCDRGGQVTYHGPGQLVVYLLLDLRRRELGVRELVKRMESAVIALLGEYQVGAERRPGAPGVYVDGAKIAALGLRVKQGCCYHGLALNVDMNLEPFLRINPCGYRGLAVTQTKDLGIRDSIQEVSERLLKHLFQAID